MSRVPKSIKVLIFLLILHLIGYFATSRMIRTGALVQQTIAHGKMLSATAEEIGERVSFGWNFSHEVKGGKEKKTYHVQVPVTGSSGSGTLKSKFELNPGDRRPILRSLHLFIGDRCVVLRGGEEQPCTGNRVKRWKRRDASLALF